MTTKERLEIIKNLSGLTQEQLAKKLGVSFVSFNNWINNKAKPRKGSVKKINNLYFLHTGQKETAENPLKAKKKAIFYRAKKHKNILEKILKNPDIYNQFMLSLTYHTDKIEGSTLTENETMAILFDNVALPGKSITEQLEAKNHQTALNYLFSRPSLPSLEIDEKFILRLHSILMNGIRDDAGSFRKQAVRIIGTYIPTANYLKVPELIKKLVKDINSSKKDVIAHISKTHSRFEKIHPFSDGNGRIGRLIIVAMLLKNNLPPAIIKQQKKRFYYSCLKKSQLKEDLIPLENFICDSKMAGILVLERK